MDLDAESPAALRNALTAARANRDTARSQKHNATNMIAKNRMLITHLTHCTQHLDAVLQDTDLQIARIQAFMSAQGIPQVDLGGDGMVYSALHGFTVSLFPRRELGSTSDSLILTKVAPATAGI